MRYSQIPDSSAIDNDDEKEVFSSWLPRNESCFCSYKILFVVTLALWVTTSATFGWLLLRREEPFRNHAATLLPFPQVPSRIVMFNPDARFHYTAKDTGESGWSSLMPNDGGIVSVDEPRDYQLPASYKNLNNSHAEVYSMSMYHQLHCLNSIRVRLGTLEGYINETELETHHMKRNVFANESHVDHCFDYLRQAIMCAGDLSLEHSVVPDEFGFNGWGTAHQCADWNVMWDFAVDMRYDQSTEQ